MAGVVLEPVSVAATPGGMATCSVRIRNTGAVVDAFTVTVLGDAATWATVLPAQLSLFPGSDGTVEVQFALPRSASVTAGPVDFAVRVAASEDPDGSVVEEGVLEVAPFTEINAKITPRTSEAKRSARHEVLVDNRGNAPVEVTLAASDPDELLAFEVRPPSLTVGPGETGRAAVKVMAAKGFAKGADKHRPFEVMVTTASPGVPPVRLDGNMVQKAGLPRFLFPLIGLAVAAAVLVLVLPALLTKKDESGTLRLANEQATSTVPAGDDEAAAAAQAAKDKADADAAAAAERAANGKDPGAAGGGGAATGAAGGATGAAAAGGAAASTASGGGGTTDTTEVTTPNAAPPPPPGATTTTPTATTVPSSTGSVRGTFSYDFDTGAETSSGADVWWRQDTSTTRALAPQGGATLANMGAADYEATDKAKLQSLTYSTAAIDGSDANNKLTPGTVIAIKTSNGRYAKMKVISKAADNTLTFRFYTYP
ncbi:MAG: hypothetical protein QOF60_123 [Actinomycetota bacterium]|jgi:hypothetical protein|nr:hypothetical protein [Actinomycetota bacterium]